MNLYNEIDSYAAQWLRGLIDAGEIPPGDVNETPIEDLNADDIVRYTQCHFFCGIAGWPLALRLAGWPDDWPVWTGSCPCQPFSVAGKGLGEDDPRHLWPAFRKLIAKCRPDVVFGEQVAGAAGLRWLSGVQADVEEDSYRLGFAELCAAGVGEKRWTAVVDEDGRVEWEGDYVVGAPHIRQRLFWVADNFHARREERRPQDYGRNHGSDSGGSAYPAVSATAEEFCLALRLGLPHGDGRDAREPAAAPARYGSSAGSDGGAGWVGNAERAERWPLDQPCGDEGRDGLSRREEGAGARHGELERSGGAAGFWSDFDILNCLDGKSRRTQSGLFPLAHGVSGRVAVRRAGQEHWYSRTGTLRGFGNAIVPQVAAEFVRAYMEAR